MSTIHSDNINHNDAPPTYTAPAPRRRPPTEHTFTLPSSSPTPWATLTLRSNAPSPRSLPSYFDGQLVAGSVSLALPKPESIHAVSLALSATIVATNANPYTFWSLERTLWSLDQGDPRSPPQPSTSKYTGKLAGAYVWPFAITLPSTCSLVLRPKHPPFTLLLPPSFSERGAAQFINYEINVRIRRGPLRIDSKLGTQFGFTPRTRPSPPSPLRRIAYHENTPLPGPPQDPDGWLVLPPLTILGRVFGVRTVEVTYTFTFALPLEYARGTPIPCMLTLTCADAQALDLLCTPTALCLSLIREVVYDGDSAAPSSNNNNTGSPISARRLANSSSALSPEMASGYRSGSFNAGGNTSNTTASSSSGSSNRLTTLTRFRGISIGSGPLEASSPADASLGVNAATPNPSPSPSSTLFSNTRKTLHTHLNPLALSRVSSVTSTTSTVKSTGVGTGVGGMSGTLKGLSSSLRGLGLSSSSSSGSGSVGASSSSAGGSNAGGENQYAPPTLRGATKAVACAVWWPSSSSQRALNATELTLRERQLEGEIMLPRELVPTFSFGEFCVSYSLALLPVLTAGFEPSPAHAGPHVLLQNIRICTQNAFPTSQAQSSSFTTSTITATTPAPPTTTPSTTTNTATTTTANTPTLTDTTSPIQHPWSRAPPGYAESQRAIHAERLARPPIWGLYYT